MQASTKPTAPSHIWNNYHIARNSPEGRAVIAARGLNCEILRAWHEHPSRHAEIDTALAPFARHPELA
jgi:hypothetical protein